MAVAGKYYSCVPTPKELDFWIQNNLNVLFVGKHGVGKTTSILGAFERNKLKYKYFSASTMDPFIDLIGIPKEIKDEKGSYIDLVRPKDFRDDQVEAIFLDEYNRSPKKVRNAVMELIQFKSINGKVFPNLKIVWAAINPDDETDGLVYDVEPLDEAQKDRFHIRVELPYELNYEYFKVKYGEKLVNAATEWWNALGDDVKKDVSPRRLDIALDIHSKGGSMRYVLPPSSNISSLVSKLKVGSITEIINSKTDSELIEKFKDENVYNELEPLLIKSTSKNKIVRMLDLIPMEKQMSLLSSNKNKVLYKYALKNINKYLPLLKTLSTDTSISPVKKRQLKKHIEQYEKNGKILSVK